MKFDAAAAPLKAELATVGFPIEGFGNTWFNFRPEHKVFIPILIRWLPRIENRGVRETIVRLLTDRRARPLAARPLVEEFKRIQGSESWVPYYKATVAGAVGVVADDSVFDEIAALFSDRRHGWSRAWLYPAFQRSRDPRAEHVLLKVLESSREESQAAISKLTIRALGNRGSSKAKKLIREFLLHSETDVRKEAGKSLDKIARAELKAAKKATVGATVLGVKRQ